MSDAVVIELPCDLALVNRILIACADHWPDATAHIEPGRTIRITSHSDSGEEEVSRRR